MPISVITTTFNCAEYISEAIRSMLNQTYSDFEYLIIDDGSTDNTENVVSIFNDERIQYYKINHVGRSNALNFGLSKCSHDWVALQDADDISLSDRLEKQIQRIQSKEDVIFGNAIFFKDRKVLFELKSQNNLFISKMYLHGNIINGTLLFNKDTILNVGGFNKEYENVEDYDLYLKIGTVAKFKNLDQILLLCRWRKNSLSRRNFQQTQKNFRAIQDYYFSSLGGQIPKYQITLSEEDKGWREFFYGNKSRSRYYWKRDCLYLRKGRVFIAFILTYFPESLFLSILKSDLILRVKYILFISREIKIQHKKMLLSELQ